LCFEDGAALRFDEEKALSILKENEVVITVDLKSGSAEDTMWTCDFSYDYVKINGSYRT
jgi:glutamate N-acetyltransferase/amino-acid N-acetyltransferase